MIAPRLAWRRARTLISVHYAANLEYRAEMVLWVLGTVLPFIMMAVWLTRGEAGGLTLSNTEIARYFFATFVVRNLTLVYVVWLFERDVVRGTLSHLLLQPMNPVWRYAADHVGERVMRLPLLAIVAGVFFAVFPDALWLPKWNELLLGIVALIATFVMRFLVQYAFAMLAFWTERAHAVEQFWALPYMFLSGIVAPLEFYPESIKWLLLYTPFPYLIWFPARVLIGGEIALAGREVSLAFGFGVILAWGVVFYLIYRGLWTLGIRKYSAMGA